MKFFRTWLQLDPSSIGMSRLSRFFEKKYEDSYLFFSRNTRGMVPMEWYSYAKITDDDSSSSPVCVVVLTHDINMGIAKVESIVEKSLDSWGLGKAIAMYTEENIYSECFNILEDDLFRMYGSSTVVVNRINLVELDRLHRHAYRYFFHEERMDDSFGWNTLEKKCQETYYSDSLKQEMSRIQYPEKGDEMMIPVQYAIEGSDSNVCKNARELLIQSLLKSGRLKSKLVYTFDFDRYVYTENNGSDPYKLIRLMTDSLVESLNGNTVVIKYGTTDKENHFNNESYQAFMELIQHIADHQTTIQLVLVLPEGRKEILHRVERYFSTPFIKIEKNQIKNARTMDYDTSVDYLKELAEEDGLKVDEYLLRLLQERLEDSRFEDLDRLYQEWKISVNLKAQYPQYAMVEQARRNTYFKSRKSGMTALEKLDHLVGLEKQKQQIHDLIKRFRMNRIITAKGHPEINTSLHMVFTGSPGTGKTEVAKLYGEILKEEGILKEGRVLTVSGSGWFVEETFDAAHGSVIFIDEAYGMLNVPGMITSLIACMEEYREDVVVILAGYEGHMNALLDSNPGFRSRIGEIISFPDYTNEDLEQIFQLMCQDNQMVCPQETMRTVRDILHRGGKRNDAGNARFVRKLFENTVGAQQVRLCDEGEQEGYTEERLFTLLPQDVINGCDIQPKDTRAREELSKLIGLKDVKQLIQSYLNFAKIQKVRRDKGIKAEFMPLHMVFLGNPGTGKTEVARAVGHILKEEGILSVGDFYETDGNEMNTIMMSRSVPKFFENAKGSVIFIDEAYTLSANTIAAIVKEMEDLRDQVVIIFAGYCKEMEQMLQINSGFTSRIRAKVQFPDYSEEELLEILDYFSSHNQVNLTDEAKQVAKERLHSACHSKNFGNARYVRTMFENALIAQGERLAKQRDFDMDELSLL